MAKSCKGCGASVKGVAKRGREKKNDKVSSLHVRLFRAFFGLGDDELSPAVLF